MSNPQHDECADRLRKLKADLMNYENVTTEDRECIRFLLSSKDADLRSDAIIALQRISNRFPDDVKAVSSKLLELIEDEDVIRLLNKKDMYPFSWIVGQFHDIFYDISIIPRLVALFKNKEKYLGNRGLALDLLNTLASSYPDDIAEQGTQSLIDLVENENDRDLWYTALGLILKILDKLTDEHSLRRIISRSIQLLDERYAFTSDGIPLYGIREGALDILNALCKRYPKEVSRAVPTLVHIIDERSIEIIEKIPPDKLFDQYANEIETFVSGLKPRLASHEYQDVRIAIRGLKLLSVLSEHDPTIACKTIPDLINNISPNTDYGLLLGALDILARASRLCYAEVAKAAPKLREIVEIHHNQEIVNKARDVLNLIDANRLHKY
ncbi:MAG TPA: hypothetical protein VE572_01140 [Nitrososphaeraceae archaeon]|jgi:hypothetical protein|nr:hypothetical protein [Nitrososphaeraceae archaeon]